MTADDVIAALGLVRHPEGGWYRETWRADAPEGTRASGTAIYFLLKAGERSHWHRVDATELWLYHAGAPLILRRAADETGPASAARLGPDIAAGEHPQLIVPKDHWQAAATTGDWTLISAVVSPAFHFEGFVLAPPDFDIPG